jgi:ferric-dicitrate binding protein FerR (iron transport regulator)
MSVERAWELMARKLAGEASEAELKELDQLLKVNPSLHFPLQTITDLWQQKPGSDQLELDAAFRKHLQRMKLQGISFAANNSGAEEPATFRMSDHPRRNKSWKLVAAAASILVAGSLIWYFSRSGPTEPVKELAKKVKAPSSEIVTRNGSRSRITLPDGSTVWLNAGSKLNYDKSFGTKLREVTLTGEAFFDVVKNPDQPFVIHTHRIDVKVLGTQFNVKSYPGEKTTEAALVKGSIEVYLHNDQSGKIILKPNQKIIVGEDSAKQYATSPDPGKKEEPIVSVRQLTIDQKDGTPVETAWVENKLAFVEEPFADVAMKLERWYGVSISFSNQKWARIPLTGTFTNESIQQALHALSVATSFHYRFTDSKTIVIGK